MVLVDIVVAVVLVVIFDNIVEEVPVLLKRYLFWL